MRFEVASLFGRRTPRLTRRESTRTRVKLSRFLHAVRPYLLGLYAGDDPTVADRYKRCGPRVAERRSEDRSNTVVGKRFQAGRRSPESQGPLPSPVYSPCNHRAAQDPHLALSPGKSCSSLPTLARIFAAPNADRLDSEPP